MENTVKNEVPEYIRYTFGDTEFVVPSRYIELSARGTGAQGMVWWVFCIQTTKPNFGHGSINTERMMDWWFKQLIFCSWFSRN